MNRDEDYLSRILGNTGSRSNDVRYPLQILHDSPTTESSYREKNANSYAGDTQSEKDLNDDGVLTGTRDRPARREGTPNPHKNTRGYEGGESGRDRGGYVGGVRGRGGGHVNRGRGREGGHVNVGRGKRCNDPVDTQPNVSMDGNYSGTETDGFGINGRIDDRRGPVGEIRSGSQICRGRNRNDSRDRRSATHDRGNSVGFRGSRGGRGGYSTGRGRIGETGNTRANIDITSRSCSTSGRGSRGIDFQQSGTQHGARDGRNSQLSHTDLNRGAMFELDTAIVSTDGDLKLESSDSSHEKKEFRPRIFGFKKMEELLQFEKGDLVIMEMLNTKGGFTELLKKSEMKNDLIYMAIELLAKLFNKCTKKHSLLELSQLIITTEFIKNHIVTLLNKLMMRSWTFKIDKLNLFMNNTCILMKNIMQRMPDKIDECNMAIVLMQVAGPTLGVSAEIVGAITEVNTMKDTLLEDKEAFRKGNLMSGNSKHRKHQDMDGLPPPENFRELPILPELKDLQFNEQPFLRKNKVDGRYDDLDHYLDVQFRLLREDYINPLRNGIREYRRSLTSDKTVKRFSDIKVYSNVHVVRPICTNKGILHVIQFDVTPFANVRWESSKRLIFGSLVCLSMDDFETILFATISERDTKEIQKGLIQVHFQAELLTMIQIKPSDKFVMIETSAYFESYQHTLRSLQEVADDEPMPMERYIIECNDKLRPPNYLAKTLVHYDFSPLCKRNADSYTSVPVINTTRWPGAKDMGLDESQYQALRLAVTKEMCIIQGPPGTGKTYIGLKIVELLLHNVKQWSENTANKSILVVCYTNHALDQFVEGIANFTDSIVRIGGRCRNETIEPFMLKNLRQKAREEKTIHRYIFERKRECTREINSLRDQIEDTGSRLMVCQLGILKTSVLQTHSVIAESHYRALQRRKSNDVVDCIMQWLDIPQLTANAEQEKSKLIAEKLTKWTHFILDDSQEIDGVSSGETGFWNIPLLQRVTFYREWITDFRKALQTKIYAMADQSMNTKENIDHMKTLLNNSRSEILDEQTIVLHVSQPFMKDIVRLVKQDQKRSQKGGQPHLCTMKRWLCLHGSVTAMSSITEALEVQDDDDSIDIIDEAEMAEQHRLIEDINEDEKRKLKDLKYDEKQLENDLAVVFPTWKEGIASSNVLRKTFLEADPISALFEQTIAEQEIWELAVKLRWSLYKLWLVRYQDALNKSIENTEIAYEELCKSYSEVLDSEDAQIISEARIVAMTTTGAAKFRNILKSINPSIIIVEEAAEVLESHIVTSLNSDCEHLILIGDHKQLRPTPTVYTLAIKYNLEISLFERMIKNKMEFATLSSQHRMRPEISELMLHIYPDLKNDQSVYHYEDVFGVDHNIFFIKHTNQESFNSETKSRSNAHEADYVAGLCNYFLLQGYKPSDITVLATYIGQIHLLKKRMPKKDFQGVYVTTVDNYQGEENEIIILSLVRSNTEDSVGFLNIDNRVCVALSRAKRGFYVIGNLSLLTRKSPLWANIVDTLCLENAVGTSLLLRCRNHKQNVILAETADDFKKSPGGGCREMCKSRLDCGHMCEKFCHMKDVNHEEYRCLKKCERPVCDAGHVCTKPCFKECGKCEHVVTKTIPKCGHDQKGPCYKDPLLWRCQSVCAKRLPCNHYCKGVCGTCSSDNNHRECEEMVDRVLKCGHFIQIQCCRNNSEVNCSADCNKDLICGHKCKGTCSSCKQGRLHIQCLEKCNRKLICGHPCRHQCSQPCPPCEKKCRSKCVHSKCMKKCGHSCTRCQEPCQWKCVHDSCNQKCGDLCDRLPCELLCQEKLKCGHLCAGICGETCLPLCIKCDKDVLATSKRGDYDLIPPLVFLEDCGHVVSKNDMDTIMFKQATTTFTSIQLKYCPICGMAISQNQRYGNIIKGIRDDINKVKDAITGNELNNKRKATLLKKAIVDVVKNQDPISADKMLSKLEDQKTNMSQTFINTLENQMATFRLIQQTCSSVRNIKQSCNERQKTSILQELIDMKLWLFESKFIPNKTSGLKTHKRSSFSQQELDEFTHELTRLNFQIELTVFLEQFQNHCQSTPDYKVFGIVKQMMDVLKSTKMTDAIADNLRETCLELLNHLPDTIFTQATLQKQKILKATSFAADCTWVKCEGKVKRLLQN